MGGAQDPALVRIRQHHAAMAAELERLGAPLATGAAAAARRSLEQLCAYWRLEVLPHARAEERTLYAAAEALPAERSLVASLVREHQALQSCAQALEALRQQWERASATEAGEGLLRAADRQAAVAAAIFRLHADKENDLVLPALLRAGRSLDGLLREMERAFQAERGRTQAAGPEAVTPAAPGLG
jgi:murein L,D-transpeptidase YcbB/YkuD